MSLKQQIDADLKVAMLSGDKVLTTTLRGIKSVILYAEVAEGSRESGLSDDAIVRLLAKESKKRQESADLYAQGGQDERANLELAEKMVIARYLPIQMTDTEIGKVVDEILDGIGSIEPSTIGKVVGLVKQKVGAAADGARVANIVKERISK